MQNLTLEGIKEHGVDDLHLIHRFLAGSKEDMFHFVNVNDDKSITFFCMDV